MKTKIQVFRRKTGFALALQGSPLRDRRRQSFYRICFGFAGILPWDHDRTKKGGNHCFTHPLPLPRGELKNARSPPWDRRRQSLSKIRLHQHIILEPVVAHHIDIRRIVLDNILPVAIGARSGVQSFYIDFFSWLEFAVFSVC